MKQRRAPPSARTRRCTRHTFFIYNFALIYATTRQKRVMPQSEAKRFHLAKRETGHRLNPILVAHDVVVVVAVAPFHPHSLVDARSLSFVRSASHSVPPVHTQSTSLGPTNPLWIQPSREKIKRRRQYSLLSEDVLCRF